MGGLKKYLDYHGIEQDTFILDTQEIKEKYNIFSQNFAPLFHTIYNAPEQCNFLTYLEEQGLDPEALYANQVTFSLNNCPINSLGAKLEEFTFMSMICAKGTELSDTDSD